MTIGYTIRSLTPSFFLSTRFHIWIASYRRDQSGSGLQHLRGVGQHFSQDLLRAVSCAGQTTDLITADPVPGMIPESAPMPYLPTDQVGSVRHRAASSAPVRWHLPFTPQSCDTRTSRQGPLCSPPCLADVLQGYHVFRSAKKDVSP